LPDRRTNKPQKHPWHFDEISNSEFSLLPCFNSQREDYEGRVLNVGQAFSTGLLKLDELYSCSINLLHMGGPRTWYIIPASEQSRFEQVLTEKMHLKTSENFIIPPDTLKSHGIRFYQLEQNAGEFIITLPRARYCHFSHGVKTYCF
jgi:histone demethylase JARID1